MKCLQPGLCSPRAVRGSHQGPRTWGKGLLTLKAAINFRGFAGCNSNLLSAAGGLAAKEPPKTQGMFANVPVRWALRRCPCSKPSTLTGLCPGAFSVSSPVFGQQEGCWGGNMRPRGFSRTGKQPQAEAGAGFPASSSSPSLQSHPFTLLFAALLLPWPCSLDPTLCPLYSNQGSFFMGVLKVKFGGENPLRSCQCLFSSFLP